MKKQRERNPFQTKFKQPKVLARKLKTLDALLLSTDRLIDDAVSKNSNATKITKRSNANQLPPVDNLLDQLKRIDSMKKNNIEMKCEESSEKV